MALHQYNQDARRRIGRAVRWTETQRRNKRAPAQRGAVVGWHKLVRASEDIEHGRVGNVRRLSGPAVDQSLSLISGDVDFKVYNPRDKIWSGSQLVVAPIALPGADTTNQTTWYVTQAWSATRIRGTSAAIIAHGTTGTLNSVKPLNGTFSPTTAQVYLPTAFKDIESTMTVWAELVYDAASQTSRWEVYSADCSGD